MSTHQKCQLVDFDDNVIEELRRGETNEGSFKDLKDSFNSSSYTNIINSFIFKFFVGFMLVYGLITIIKKFESVLIKKETAVNSGDL